MSKPTPFSRHLTKPQAKATIRILEEAIATMLRYPEGGCCTAIISALSSAPHRVRFLADPRSLGPSLPKELLCAVFNPERERRGFWWKSIRNLHLFGYSQLPETLEPRLLALHFLITIIKSEHRI